LIAPAFLYFMVSLHQQLLPSVTMTKIAGFTLAFFYFLAATLSYGAQLTLVPNHLRQNAVFMAELWYFFNPASLAYFINQTGYALWALAVMTLFWPLVKRGGVEKGLGILFMLSAALSLTAYAGLLAEVPSLASLTLVSGGLTIPIPVLALILAIRKLKMTDTPAKHEAAVTPQDRVICYRSRQKWKVKQAEKMGQRMSPWKNRQILRSLERKKELQCHASS